MHDYQRTPAVTVIVKVKVILYDSGKIGGGGLPEGGVAERLLFYFGATMFRGSNRIGRL